MIRYYKIYPHGITVTIYRIRKSTLNYLGHKKRLVHIVQPLLTNVLTHKNKGEEDFFK